jgi:transcriptional regulator with XRE-family HTH domain
VPGDAGDALDRNHAISGDQNGPIFPTKQRRFVDAEPLRRPIKGLAFSKLSEFRYRFHATNVAQHATPVNTKLHAVLTTGCRGMDSFSTMAESGKRKRSVRPLYLREWMTHAKKSNGDIIAATGADKGLVSRWLNSGVQPSEDRLLKLAALFGCTRDQLHQKPTKPFTTFDPDHPDAEADETMTHGSETGLRGVPDGASPQLDVTAGMGAGGITIVSEGVRGKSGMTFAAEDISDYWRVPPVILASMGNVKATDITFVPCQGDSMAPTLLEGDVVVVDTRHRWPSPDGLYALTDPFGGIIVKRLHVTDEGSEDERVVMVVSDNPKHDTRRVSLAELRIVGRVIRKFGLVG